MKKIICLLLAVSVMLSLAPAMGEGLVKGPPTPPPFARDEDGSVVVSSTRTPVSTAVPTVRPTATPAPVNPDAPVLMGGEVPDMGGVLCASVDSASTYARVGESNITLTVNITGGTRPYAVRFTVENGGEMVHDVTSTITAAGTWSFAYAPMKGGKHALTLTVTDLTGTEKKAEATVNVSADDSEGQYLWKKSTASALLTGDWRNDLVAVARTQIGYSESSTDFIMDEETGLKHGYTRYGDWYGSKYGEWCATFIAFCCEYAGIAKADFPRAALVQDLMDAMDDAGAGEDYRYQPSVGDLVFLSFEGDYAPEHVGIVENVSGSRVYTIEGNSSDQVRRREYALNADEIVGYASTAALMRKAGLLTDEAAVAALVLPDAPIGTAVTTRSDVNMRVEADQQSARVKKISDRGTQVDVLLAEENGWYFVQYRSHLGYVRGDLLQVTLTSEAPEGITPEDWNAWLEAVAPTEEMMARAKLAAGLDKLVLEGDAFVYVRTGEAMAHYDRETGLITDIASGLAVAVLDEQSGSITPASAQ